MNTMVIGYTTVVTIIQIICIWWEAVNMETGCADYHANTKKDLMDAIDGKLTI